MRQSDNEVFDWYQIFVGKINLRINNFCTSIITIARSDILQFFLDDSREAIATRQNIQKITNAVKNFLVFRVNLVLLKARQTVQAQIQDGLRLGIRQAIDIAVETSSWVCFERSIQGSIIVQHRQHYPRLPGTQY